MLSLARNRNMQVVRILRTLICCSTMLVLTSACVVIEKESSHKLISGQVKTSSNIYNFRKVSRYGYERTHEKDRDWTFYADTGSSTFAYNAIDRQIRIVVWPEKVDFEYVQNSGTVEQSDGEIYPIQIRTRSGSKPSSNTFSSKIISGRGRSDLNPSFGGIFILRSAGEGYTGYPEDSRPVSIYLPYKLNGVEHELNLSTQRYVRRKLGFSDLTFTGNP